MTKFHWFADYIAFAAAAFVGYVGTWLTCGQDLMTPEVNFVYLASCRQIFGLGIAYLMLRVIQPAEEDTYIVSFTRSFLASSVWVPIAVLGYACYMFHMVFMFGLYEKYSLPKLEEGDRKSVV